MNEFHIYMAFLAFLEVLLFVFLLELEEVFFYLGTVGISTDYSSSFKKILDKK